MYAQPAQKKPTAAAVLSILAGVIGLAIALYHLVDWITTGAYGAYAALSDYSYYADLATSVFVLGLVLVVWIIVSSILVLVGGARINSHPESHIRWGIVILLFSIIGLGLTVLFVPLWTGFLGIPITVLGIVGGILALAFKPSTPTPQAYGYQQPYPPQGYPPQQQAPYQQPYPPQQPYAQQAPQQIKRICPQCGRVVDENLRFCPNCGKSLA